MRLRYLPRATADLAGIAEFLSTRNPVAARAVAERIRAAAAMVCEFPGVGRRLEERPTVRVVPIGRFPYLLFYSVAGDEVLILHVRHGAREPPNPEEV